MSRKVYVKLAANMIIRVDEGVSVEDVLSEMDYNFSDTTGSATIEDTNITAWEVDDSK
jgi:hypothetical protein